MDQSDAGGVVYAPRGLESVGPGQEAIGGRSEAEDGEEDRGSRPTDKIVL